MDVVGLAVADVEASRSVEGDLPRKRVADVAAACEVVDWEPRRCRGRGRRPVEGAVAVEIEEDLNRLAARLARVAGAVAVEVLPDGRR